MPLDPVGKDFFYNAQGGRVWLQAAAGAFAVRFVRGVRSDSELLTAESRLFLRDQCEHVDFLPHYGLQVFRAQAGVAGASPQGRRAAGAPPVAAKHGLSPALDRLHREVVTELVTPAFRFSKSDERVFVTDLFVVEFKPGLSDVEIRALNDRHGVRVVEVLGYAQERIGFVLEAPKDSGPLGAIELSKAYFESGLVVYANPDLIRKRAFHHADTLTLTDSVLTERDASWPYASEQWHIAKARVDKAWASTMGDPRITVCIADDGVDVSHPAFAARVVGEYDFEGDIADATPKSGLDNHGTACAGVAVAADNDVRGASPGCKLLAVRTPAYLGAVDEARMFQWIADNNADVLSCSWGPPDGAGEFPLMENIASAIDYCVTRGRGGKGIPIFWAAGNGNESVAGDGYATHPRIIAVAASTEKDVKAYYSDFGESVWVCAPSSGRKADGERRIWTVDRVGQQGYNAGDPAKGDAQGLYTNSFGGTSAAAPLAAGVAALMLSANPSLTWSQVRQILAQTAEKIGPAGEYDTQGHSPNFGFGRINAEAAVTMAASAAVNAPASPAPAPTPQASPQITGPASLLRTDAPPVLACASGSNPFFAVELATDGTLFNTAAHAGDRTEDNFYATWQDSGFLTGSSYAVPAGIWHRLSAADKVFYRLISSSSSSRWENTARTVPDALVANAPFVQIVDAATDQAPSPSAAPFVQGPPSVGRSEPAPTFSAGVQGAYYAIEVATRSNLFIKAQHGVERDAGNFFATWQLGRLLSAPQYTLPAAVWNVLKTAPRLYYRLITSDSPSAWVHPQVTTPDSQAHTAPYLSIIDRAPSPLVSRFKVERDIVERGVAEAFDDEAPAPDEARPAKGPAGPVADVFVVGPESYDRASDVGPSFLLSLGAGQYGALEVVTDPLLWETAAQDPLRTPENHFGSWRTAVIQAGAGPSSTTTFTLPVTAWLSLRHAQRLFYRVLSTRDPTRWTEVRRSYPQPGVAAPPLIEIKGRAVARTEKPLHRPEESLWRDDLDE